MKILQVIPFFSPKFGGSVTVPFELSQELAKRNHQVTILTSDYGFDPQYADGIRAGGVNVIHFHCVLNIGQFLFSPSMKKWLEKNLKDYDIIHLHNYRSYQNVVIHKYAIRQGIPYIIQAHGSVLPFFEKQELKKLYDFVWGRRILRNASKCIAVSIIERDQYLTMGLTGKKIVVIPNGINVSDYEKLPEQGKFRKKHGITADEKIILYLGRLHKSKGLDFLINGFSGILDQHQAVKLVIAGPDDGFLDVLLHQIKQMRIEERVLVTGPLYTNEKLEAFVDADILVYPGIFEIFGLVPFEAIMCGTPVIVADDCGCGEIIQEAGCGYLVKFGDIIGLSKKMSEVLENPQSAKGKILAGQHYIRAHLTWDTTILKFEELYEDCLRNL